MRVMTSASALAVRGRARRRRGRGAVPGRRVSMGTAARLVALPQPEEEAKAQAATAAAAAQQQGITVVRIGHISTTMHAAIQVCGGWSGRGQGTASTGEALPQVPC